MKSFTSWLPTFICLFFFSCPGRAEVDHLLLRRVAVFPIGNANFANAEEAWWQMRETLTKDPKLVVASRRFMINRGAFQSHTAMRSADVIILGKILEAQAMVVSWLENRVLKVKVYDGESGYLLWEGESSFHPAVAINEQIVKAGNQLMKDFLTAIPYQAYQVSNEQTGQLLTEEGDRRFATIFIGSAHKITVGDPVQWVKVSGDPSQPFFSSAKVTVVAEGEVWVVNGDHVIAEVKKVHDMQDLKEEALIRFPKEVVRMKELQAVSEKTSTLMPEYLVSEVRPIKNFEKGHSSTSTALAFITNLVAFLLIAF